MRIVLVNKFLYPKGGDATATLSTGELLRSHGHDVILWGMAHPLNAQSPYSGYFVRNADFEAAAGAGEKLRLTGNILYSWEARGKFTQLIKKYKPDLVHLNNFAHQISPSILHVTRRHGIPAVMTMHDYKLVCASYALKSRGGRLCEKCTGGRYYHCFLEGCVKDSRAKSLVNTMEMYLHHKVLGLYNNIDVFMSPSRFLKAKVLNLGLKGHVEYLPNFIHAAEYEPAYAWTGRSILYFGRLSHEKGLPTLLRAAQGADVELNIVGDGPLREGLASEIECLSLKNVHLLGYKSGNDLKQEIRKAMFVVLPSGYYENNPRSVIEAFASGKPVLASRSGGNPELVKDGVTGMTFQVGDHRGLREKIDYLLAHPGLIVSMGRAARQFVEDEFSAEKHYTRLMSIYRMAVEKRSTGARI